MNLAKSRSTANHFEVEPEQSQFKMIFADITHRCNMRCHNCYLPNRDIPDMDIDKLLGVLERLPKSVDVRLIGAEPTMRSDLEEIIKRVLRLGHRVSLVTNGLKLADKDYCERLVTAGLRVVNISINGGDDDSLYQKIDGGKYAKLKSQAIENSLALGLRLGTGTIISRGCNEAAIEKSLQLIVSSAKRLGLRFPNRGYAPLMRFKNIGAIGRYQSEGQMSFSDLMAEVCVRLGIPREAMLQNISARGTIYIRPVESAKEAGYFVGEEPRSYFWELSTEVGSVYVMVNDWNTGDLGVPDAGNLNRGRVTKDWKVAPFFEDVKHNEFGY